MMRTGSRLGLTTDNNLIIVRTCYGREREAEREEERNTSTLGVILIDNKLIN